jgi:hypothetical protein
VLPDLALQAAILPVLPSRATRFLPHMGYSNNGLPAADDRLARKPRAAAGILAEAAAGRARHVIERDWPSADGHNAQA